VHRCLCFKANGTLSEYEYCWAKFGVRHGTMMIQSWLSRCYLLFSNKQRLNKLIHNFSTLIKNLSRYRHAGDKGERIKAPTHYWRRHCMGVTGQRHASGALYLRYRGSPRYPLDRRLGGSQSCSGHRDLRKNPLSLPEIEHGSPGRPVCRQILYYWLGYPSS
jgi:hypothetical protein